MSEASKQSSVREAELVRIAALVEELLTEYDRWNGGPIPHAVTERIEILRGALVAYQDSESA